MMIQVTEKPQSGKRERVCLVCGDPFVGWNMYACKPCERIHNYTIVEVWNA